MAKKVIVGIIGLGSFGSFIKTLMPRSVKLLTYDLKVIDNHAVTLEEMSVCDTIILAIPLSSYDETLSKLAKIAKKDSLIIDVCSVKQQPEEKFNKYLKNHSNVLLTHPLFGSQSAAKTTKGHDLIITKSVGPKAELAVKYCSKRLGLNVSHLSSAEHDRIMAQVHALTFFIARSLKDMDLPQSIFKTPSYSMIDRFIKIDHDHSQELFDSIQAGNQFAKDIRHKFINSARRVHEDIN